MTSRMTTSRPMIPNPVPAMASSIRNLYPPCGHRTRVSADLRERLVLTDASSLFRSGPGVDAGADLLHEAEIVTMVPDLYDLAVCTRKKLTPE